MGSGCAAEGNLIDSVPFPAPLQVQTDDISHILILNRKGSADAQPALFATELEKFRPHQQRLTQTLQAQQSALADVNNGFKTLTESSKARQVQGQWADAERKKRDLITRLGRAAQAYGDVRTALEKGLHFYQDLNDLVDGLQQQVNGWISMRTSERERMAAEAEIKQRLEDGASGPSAASGPSGLDRAMGSLNLGLGGARSPPPSGPSPSAYSQPISYPSSASSPPPSNPYGSFPSTGAFSLSSPPPEQPSAHSQYARPPAPQQSSYSSSSAYSPAPSYPTAPPIPPVQPSYPSYGSGQPSYPSPAPSNVSSYGQPARQASFPAPPQPVTQSSYLPPPPQPVSYQSSGYGQPGQYGQPAGGPPPPPSRPPQPSYSQQQQYPQYGSGPPQPPPRPY